MNSTLLVNYDRVRKHHIGMRVPAEELLDGAQSAGLVLLVAIEVGQNLTRCPPPSPVDGIVHALVLLEVGSHPPIPCQPLLRAVVRLGVLHDMLDLVRQPGQPPMPRKA